MSKNLPCPFCGSSDIELKSVGDWACTAMAVVCNDCDMEGPTSSEIKKAERLWNKRIALSGRKDRRMEVIIPGCTNPLFCFPGLRKTGKMHPVFAQIMSPIIQIIYIAQMDTFCLADQHGNLYTHEECKKLIIEIEKFHEIFSEEDITKSNNTRNDKSLVHHHILNSKAKAPKLVYLISKNESNYKIGISSNPKERLKQFKIVEPSVQLLHAFKADNALRAEEVLHHIFRKKNVGGEWFKLSEEDIAEFQSVIEYKDSQFIRR